MKRNALILLFIITFFGDKVYATHNMCGQITYKHLTGLTYEVTVKTFTYAPSPADRPVLNIKWGDGIQDTIPRTQKIYLGNDINENTYVGTHTYSSPSVYIISLEDPNRNAAIINIPNSVNIPFYIESMIYVFDPAYYCVVNSVDFFSTLPLIKQLNDNHFKFNLTAYDPDNDSISYELISCKGEDGLDIPGYTIPTGVHLNAYNGEFRWDDSPLQGEYCFAAKIKKWRNGQNISYVLKDFMITVISLNAVSYTFSGTDSLMTDINGNYYTTLNPNDTLNLKITYYDSNSSHQTAIHSFSEVFLLNNPAIYSSDSAMNISNGYLQWIPKIENGRKRPYLFTFRGYSIYNQNNIEILNDLSLFIYVIGNNDTVCPPFPIDYSINDKNDYSDSIKIFPNPAKNSITVENKIIGPHNYVVSIKNIQGQEVLSEKINFTTTYLINVSCLRDGIYFLTLRNEKKNYVSKIVIQK